MSINGKISRRSVLTMATAGAVLAPLAISDAAWAAPSGNGVVFSDGFEGGDFSRWVRQNIQGNGTMDLVRRPEPVRCGRQAARFMVPDDGPSFRSEIALDSPGWGSFSYRFSNRLASDWYVSTYDTILAQWHGYPLASSGLDTNPPMSLHVLGSDWQIQVHTLDPTDDTKTIRQRFPLGPIEPGKWNDWVFDVTWSTPDTSGSVQVRQDGHVVMQHDGINNYHQNQSPYFKVGIYRPNWNPAKGHTASTGEPPVVVYDDEVKILQRP